MNLLPEKNLDELLAESDAILAAAVEEHNPSKIFACFSGGDDSLTTALVASRHPRFTGCIHINTGIGIPETNAFVRRSCHERGWPLVELHPTDKTYEEFVLEHGFPGPAAHRYCYVWLKERALNWFVSNVAKDSTHDRVMLVTGVRLQESRRRMGSVEKVQRQGCKVWVAPVLYWSKKNCLDFIAREGAARNEVVRLLHMSGECLCGAFANNDKTNELGEVGVWFPEVRARIERLQEQARERGVHCKWGEAPPEAKRELAEEDLPLFSMCQRCDAFLPGREGGKTR